MDLESSLNPTQGPLVDQLNCDTNQIESLRSRSHRDVRTLGLVLKLKFLRKAMLLPN